MKTLPRPVRLIAAPYTAFTANGELALQTVEEQVELLVDNGLAGAFVCGTTGESMSMTIAERRLLAETWLKAAAGRLQVLVHVGHTSQRDAIELAAHAAHHGATATAAMAPCFAKPADVEALVDFCVPIAAAAADLPFYFYHIPPMTNVNLSMARFLEVAGDRIPNLVGLKYSHDDLVDLQAALAVDGGRFEILFGKDEILLAALALGIRGAVGSTYNFMTPLYGRVISAFDTGDLATAQRELLRAVELVRTLIGFGPAGFAAGKSLMGRLGIDCGPVRAPLRNLSREQAAALDAALVRLDFDSYCSRTSRQAAPKSDPLTQRARSTAAGA